jgi:hypothetical protein
VGQGVWLNFVIGALFFLAIAGIPLWLVFRHPESQPEYGHHGHFLSRQLSDQVPIPVAVMVQAPYADGRAVRAPSTSA